MVTLNDVLPEFILLSAFSVPGRQALSPVFRPWGIGSIARLMVTSDL
jgi:hypothetical protein